MATQLRAKELRALLKEANAQWQTNPNFDSNHVIKEHPLGGEPPHNLKPASEVPKLDLKKEMGGETNNPFLQERRKALGFITETKNKRLLTNLSVDTAHAEEMILTMRPPVVDWRNRFGWPWITKVKDQDPCESCWAFGATGVVESMVRIEHAVWSKRSEGDVHDGMGSKCANGGWPSNALDWIVKNGLADPDCWGYYTDNRPYAPSADRSGRTTRLATYVTLGNTDQQKQWIDAVGPITGCFEVYHDFDGYHSGVYHKLNSPSNYYRGNHCVTIVGYDDNQQCWICKNSWGAGWGNAGYVLIGYGEVNIDGWAKYGVQYTNPDPWTKRRLHNGNIIESGNGALHRNFEVLGLQGSAVKAWYRDGSSLAWGSAAVFGNDAAACPTLTSTTFNRNFECVYLTGQRRLHHWWFDQVAHVWKDGGVFGPTDAYGIPGFIQSKYNKPGNFEVVVRTLDGRLNHWWRDGGGWHDGGRFGASVALSGATLIQSRYGINGNLELVAVCTSGQMQHYWRDDDHGFVWHAGVCFGSNVHSTPVMIEGQFGATDEDRVGNYELCVQVGGQIQHWWRDNQGGTGWHMSATFGHNIRTVVGLVEGSFGFDLEVIAINTSNQLQHFWRDGAGWHEGVIIGAASLGTKTLEATPQETASAISILE